MCFWIDLLTEHDEELYGRHPDELSKILKVEKYKYVVIDEIQKFPKLLDIVHKEIEEKKVIFILTGSSARKLKKVHANLLAGRAFSYNLYPLTSFEIGDLFNLAEVLCFGTLPKIYSYDSDEDKRQFLRTYAKTYLKEEIIAEQIIRNVEPFRDFLEVAAQMNGQIINYSKISRDIGVDDKTILKNKLLPRTSEFGNAFVHWVIVEAVRLNSYTQSDHVFSFLRTKDDAEIDLVIQRPGESDLLVEIKSSERIEEKDTSILSRFQKDWDKKSEAQIWYLGKEDSNINNVMCINWKSALEKLYST